MNDLLAQRKEIRRLEKEVERKQTDQVEVGVRDEEEATARAVREFELVQMGLDVKPVTKDNDGRNRILAGREGGKIPMEDEAVDGKKVVEGTKDRKRRFELDEEELLRIASKERSRAKRAIVQEKVYLVFADPGWSSISLGYKTSQAEASKATLPSFWVSSVTPSSNTSNVLHQVSKPIKLQPFCPASSKDQPHHYSLKSLITVHFTEDKKDDDDDRHHENQTNDPVRVCPSCKKVFTNGMKAMRKYSPFFFSFHHPRDHLLVGHHLLTLELSGGGK